MRILLHYTHKQTLGHTTRIVSLVKALCRQKANVLVLQGGVPQPFIHFPKNCKVMDVPFPFDSRSSFQSQTAPVSAAKRAQFILKAAKDHAPDVFITEFFPFGRLAYIPELLPTLRYLRQQNTRIMASIGYPLLGELERLQDRKFAALHQALLAFYDTFLIHTPQDLETPYIQKAIHSEILSKSYATIIKKLKKKIVYTGYIVPEKIMTGGAKLPPMNDSIPTVVISRGGGAVYPKLITLAIEAQRLLDHKIHTIIACGPATTSAEMAFFQSCLKPQDKGRVFLANHLDDLDQHLRTCRVSVCLCGYNTSVQLMRHGTPSVIVPYQNTLSQKSTNDQMARAQLLKEKFSSIILDYAGMTAPSLAAAIHQQLNRPRPDAAPKDWFNGASVSARLIMQS